MCYFTKITSIDVCSLLEEVLMTASVLAPAAPAPSPKCRREAPGDVAFDVIYEEPRTGATVYTRMRPARGTCVRKILEGRGVTDWFAVRLYGTPA